MSFRQWRERPDDFVVVATERIVSGEKKTTYHIFDVRKKISHIVERQSVARDIVQEMIEAGVRVVDMDEATRLLKIRYDKAE